MIKVSKKILNLMGFEITRIKRVKHKSDQIAFLHIGKNAGTQVLHLARQLKYHGIYIYKYGHGVKLSDLPRDARYFFSIRKPDKRFVSGFYSRKRKGQPKTYNEWSPHEKIAFEAFEHANDLAENLFNDDMIGNQARQAIKSISHTGMQQYDWFQRSAFLDVQPPITIIRQEHFRQDMQRFMDLVNVEIDIETLFTDNKMAAHKNDYDTVPALSDASIANLERWYAQDYWFYKMCEAWLEERASQ